MGASSLHPRRRQLNRLAYAQVRHAAAETSSHDCVYGLVGWIRIVLEQRGSLHDLPRLAIAALRHLEFEPGSLQWVFSLWIQSLDCRHLGSSNRAHRSDAGASGAPLDMHGAGAAHTDAASEFGSRQTKFVTNHPEQGCVVWAMHRDISAIENKCSHDPIAPVASLFLVFSQSEAANSRRTTDTFFSRFPQGGRFVRVRRK